MKTRKCDHANSIENIMSVMSLEYVYQKTFYTSLIKVCTQIQANNNEINVS